MLRNECGRVFQNTLSGKRNYGTYDTGGANEQQKNKLNLSEHAIIDFYYYYTQFRSSHQHIACFYLLKVALLYALWFKQGHFHFMQPSKGERLKCTDLGSFPPPPSSDGLRSLTAETRILGKPFLERMAEEAVLVCKEFLYGGISVLCGSYKAVLMFSKA